MVDGWSQQFAHPKLKLKPIIIIPVHDIDIDSW